MSTLEWIDSPPTIPDPPTAEVDGLYLTITQPLTSAGTRLPHDVVRVHYHASPEPGFLPKSDSYLGYRVVTLGDIGAGTIGAKFHFDWSKERGKLYVKTSLGNRIGGGPFSLEIQADHKDTTEPHERAEPIATN